MHHTHAYQVGYEIGHFIGSASYVFVLGAVIFLLYHHFRRRSHPTT